EQRGADYIFFSAAWRYRQTPNFEQARHGVLTPQEPPTRPISWPCYRNGGRGKILDLQDTHEIVAIAASDLEAKGRGNDVDGAVAGKHHLADDIDRLVVG